MNRKALRFAVVRFMPYVQTREFANIGIVAVCPKTKWFDYRIEQRYSRLSGFFRYFDGKVYKAAIRSFQEELERVRAGLQHADEDQIRAAFALLTRPREAIMQTGSIGTSLAENEEQELQRLFDYYVAHSFAKDKQEETLTKKVAKWVRDLNLELPFTEQRVGNDEYHVSLPLVQQSAGQVHKIIKPIYLGHEEAFGIYQKADQWQAKFKRLKDFRMIQSDTGILLPYIPPAEPSGAQNRALTAVLDDFKRHGIRVAHQDDKRLITQFTH